MKAANKNTPNKESLTSEKNPREITKVDVLINLANYIFKKILPQYGYAVRDKQIELAEHILGVTAKRGITLAESEVGTGKTHAYLIAAVLAKRGRLNDFWLRGSYRNQSWAESAHLPVVISTSSIALQNAIVKDYMPELSRILIDSDVIKRPLTAVIRKGREHYICEKQLKIFYSAADESTKTRLTPFIGRLAPFDLTDADGLTVHMKRYICVPGQCREDCKYRRDCRYLDYINRANSPMVDFQITNHNYFLADMNHRVAGKKPLIPHYQMVVIDEAHKFLAAARSMYGLELTDRELPGLVKEVHTFTPDTTNSDKRIHDLTEKLKDQSKRLFKQLDSNIPSADYDDEAERLPAVMDSDVIRHLRSITGIATVLATESAGSKIPRLYRERRDRAVRRLKDSAELASDLRSQGRLIYWLENRAEGETESRALCAIPMDLDKRLFYDLWNRGIPMILTSGTLSASGDFTRAKETLGLNMMPVPKLFSVSMPSPFDYKNNVMLYVSENTVFPNNSSRRYIQSIAGEIERLVRASHGHAAVLFTSYNVMGQVHAILKRRGLPFPLFRLERGGIHAIEHFKKSGNGILFASGSLWEGIDIPGDTLSMLIIVKLPFQVPDPVGEYERSLFSNMELYKARVIVPDMLIKLMQGFGRLIRNETDTGVVAILDSRVSSRGAYREKVISALPVRMITSRMRMVRRFFRRVKSKAYFSGLAGAKGSLERN